MNHDALLIDAMRSGNEAAWGAFAARFRPILHAYARKANIPVWEWATCITEVLDDEALRLVSSGGPLPVNLASYLIRAVHHRYLRVKRAAIRRERAVDAAGDLHSGEWVVSTVCSQDTLRSSAGPDAADVSMSDALSRLARELRTGLTDEEESILVWTSEGVSHRQIAEWLCTSYDACTKRIWRLCRRLRTQAAARATAYSPEDQVEIDRFVRRAVEGASSSARHKGQDERPDARTGSEAYPRGNTGRRRMATGS